MSHFTTVKTKITDLECLKSAVKDLGYNYEENKIEITDYEKRRVIVDLAIKSGTGYDIGCKWNGLSYDIIADWMGVGREISQTFIPKLTQKYAYHKTKEVLSEKGFVLAEEEVNEKNEIVLTVRQW